LMTNNPHKFAAADFAVRLAVFYAALFITLGVQLPFLPIWLAAKGLDAGMIGIVLALPMIVRVFAIPAAALVADRHDALRAVIIIAAGASVAGFGALAFAEGLVAIMTLFAVASIAYTPVILLADAYALRGLAQWGRAYGPVRLWGSAAFIVATFGAGYLLDAIEPGRLIWLIVAAMGMTAVAALLLAPLEPGRVCAPAIAPSARWLLRDPTFLAFTAAASLIQASHAVYYGFSTIDWLAAGFDGVSIGALWALGVLAEIALFAISARLPAAMSPTGMLLIGAAAAAMRWTVMAMEPPAALLPAVQCLHALSFGATHLGTLAFVARVAPPGLATTVQGYIMVALGLAMAVAMGISGVLYGRYGGLAYGAMAVAACAGGLCALAAHRIVRAQLEINPSGN
jgi:PPP family 3-phenylpropionic acid transporter